MNANATTGRSIEKEIFVAVSPERAFRAFVDTDDLEHWFAIKAEIDARPGGDWTMTWSSMAATGTIVEIDPPRLLVMETVNEPPFGNTILRFEFTPESDGTLVRLINSGFGTGDDWDAYHDGVNSGWGDALRDLKRWLEDGASDGSFRLS